MKKSTASTILFLCAFIGAIAFPVAVIRQRTNSIRAGITASPRALSAEVLLARSRLWHKRPEQKIEIEGAVVDAWTYAAEIKGASAEQQRRECVLAYHHGGVLPAIVDDQGHLYIAAKYKGFKGCQELLEPYISKRVRITGLLGDLGNSRLLKIETVKEVR